MDFAPTALATVVCSKSRVLSLSMGACFRLSLIIMLRSVPTIETPNFLTEYMAGGRTGYNE